MNKMKILSIEELFERAFAVDAETGDLIYGPLADVYCKSDIFKQHKIMRNLKTIFEAYKSGQKIPYEVEQHYEVKNNRTAIWFHYMSKKYNKNLKNKLPYTEHRIQVKDNELVTLLMRMKK